MLLDIFEVGYCDGFCGYCDGCGQYLVGFRFEYVYLPPNNRIGGAVVVVIQPQHYFNIDPIGFG